MTTNLATNLTTERSLEAKVKSILCRRGTYVIMKTIITKHDNPDSIGIELTCKGNATNITVGCTYAIRGKPAYDKNYKNWYLFMNSCEQLIGTDELGLVNFLAADAPFLGRVRAQKLVNTYGITIIELMRTDLSVINSIPGLSQPQRDELRNWVCQREAESRAKVKLHALGLTPNQIVKILEFFQGDISKLQTRCYELTDVHGFGFLTVDRIALLTGVPKFDVARIHAGIRHAVNEYCTKTGSTCISEENAIKAATELLDIGKDMISAEIEELLKLGDLVRSM